MIEKRVLKKIRDLNFTILIFEIIEWKSFKSVKSAIMFEIGKTSYFHAK